MKQAQTKNGARGDARSAPAKIKSAQAAKGDARAAPPAVRRAKVLDADQFREALKYAKASGNPARNEVVMRLSFQAGLRAKEIAGLRWKTHVLGSDGKVGRVLYITSDIGKRTVEREIPMANELRDALTRLYQETWNVQNVIYRLDRVYGPVLPNTLIKWLGRFFAELGYVGATSHSGRRTFITNTARIANNHGSSLRDVQLLAGHKRLETTAGYIEPSSQQRALVNNVFGD